MLKRKIFSQAHWGRIEDRIEQVLCGARVAFVPFADLYFIDHRPVHRPWAGILHDPPETSSIWTDRNIFKTSSFIASLPWCVHIFTMSEPLAQQVREHRLAHSLQFNVTVLLHPLPTLQLTTKWQPEAYVRAKPKLLVQIGNWLRRTYSIYLVNGGSFHSKLMIPNNTRTLSELDMTMSRDGVTLTAEQRKSVRTTRLTESEYRDVLMSGVIYLDLYASTANNVVLEAIAHHTPIILRRMPALEAFLTREYPLFFDHLDEVPGMLSEARVVEAHHFLERLPKGHLTTAHFVSRIQEALSQYLK